MHKSFYVSGFLFSPKTHQILLLKFQQKDGKDFLWSTLGGDSSNGEDAQIAFQRLVNKVLNIDVKTKDIYPIYDYLHQTRNKMNFVFYAEVKNPKKLNSFKKDDFSWVYFDEISKLPFTAQTKQDVIVGERVINAKWRDNEAKKLAPFLKPTLSSTP